ncbi:uncharacterized protein LOC142337579 isoform X2 [Convolutriloba macropyga]|uniref:uncharacterized protein LOC142337579 isoform X2 n=1 Tax=Convolutriloba macropyga TaxID=536237 RepID=UPI003F51B810
MEQKQLEHSNSLTDISTAVAVNSGSCETTSNQPNNEGIRLPMTGHNETIDESTRRLGLKSPSEVSESVRQLDLKSPSEVSESTVGKRLSMLTLSGSSSVIDSSLLDVNISTPRSTSTTSTTRRNDIDLSSLGLGSESFSPKLRASRSRSYGVRSTYTESGDLDRIPLSPSLFRRPRSLEVIRIVEHLRTLQAVDKESVTMYCRFEGELESVKWLHEGKPIRNGVDFRQFSPLEGLVCLTINDVMYPEDGGNYTCVLTAKKGVPSDDLSDEGSENSITVSCDTFLDVRKGLKGAAYRRLDKRTSCLGGGGSVSVGGSVSGRSESLLSVLQGNISPTPPVLLSTPANIVDALDGDNLSLRCRVHGSEPMTIEWLHPKGHQIVGGQGQEDFTIEIRPTPTGDSFRSSLTISDVIAEDSGLWTFRVTNKYGTAKTVMKVNVQGNSGQKTEPQLPQSSLPAILSPQHLETFNLSRDPHTSYAAPLDNPQALQNNSRKDNRFDSLLPFATVRISRSSESPLFRNDLSFTMTKEFHTDYATEPRKPKRELQKSQSLNAYDLSPTRPSLKQPKSPIRTDFHGLPFGKVSIEKKTQLNEATKFAIEIGSSSNSDQSLNKEKAKEATENVNGYADIQSPTYSRTSSVSMKTSSSSSNSFGQVKSSLSSKSEKYKRSKPLNSLTHSRSTNNSRKDEIINFLQSLPESAFTCGSLGKIDISMIKDELKNNSLTECSVIPKVDSDNSTSHVKNSNSIPLEIESTILDPEASASNQPQTDYSSAVPPITNFDKPTNKTVAEEDILNSIVLSTEMTSKNVTVELSLGESQIEPTISEAKDSDAAKNLQSDLEKRAVCSNPAPTEPVTTNEVNLTSNSEKTALDMTQEPDSNAVNDSLHQKPSTSTTDITEAYNDNGSLDTTEQQSKTQPVNESTPVPTENKTSPKVVQKRAKSAGKIPIFSAIGRTKSENPKNINAQNSTTASNKATEPQPTLLQKPSPKLKPKIAKIGVNNSEKLSQKDLSSQNVKASVPTTGVPNSTLQQWRNNSNVDVSSSNQSANTSTPQLTRRRAPGSKLVNKPQISNA